ncbi:MAG: hypothetical protein MI673_09565 [Thiotrichales bacterium]|nr:hypothetical protein [Thiotrichales bacterium]
MDAAETIRLVTTAAVIIILLTLQYFYKQRFVKNSRQGSSTSKLVGALVLFISFALAWWLMNK